MTHELLIQIDGGWLNPAHVIGYRSSPDGDGTYTVYTAAGPFLTRSETAASLNAKMIFALTGGR